MALFTRDKKKEEEPGFRKSTAMYLHDLCWMLSVVLVLFLVFFRIIVVSGPSMKRTLLDGDYLLLYSNLFYHQPQRGDVVVVSKQSYDNGKPIVKRVIATEGQTVDIDFSAGSVTVDGVELDEPYINELTFTDEGTEFPLTLGEGEIFVMGDNRNHSTDSRDTRIGAVDTRYVVGRAVALALPGPDSLTGERDFSRIGLLH